MCGAGVGFLQWVQGMQSEQWMCLECGWIYDSAYGDPERGVPAGTPWDQVPADWVCPECGAPKSEFEKVDF